MSRESGGLYAQKTKVPVEQTRTEIERTVNRYGATAFAFMLERERAIIVFEAKDRRVRFDLPLQQSLTQSQLRQKWRALLLCIKSKLESVASGIETFEEAFLAHVVLPDGDTVGEHIAPRLATTYQSGKMQPLMLTGPAREADA